MSKKLIIVLFLGVCFLSPRIVSAIDWQNGEIGFSLNDYGRIRTFTEPAHQVQGQRISMLVGIGSDAVFDYQFDADNVDPADSIVPPAYGDYEAYVNTDNAWSMAPPDVEVANNVYGWDTGGCVLVKYTIRNIGSAVIDAMLGHEYLPEINYEVSGSYVNVTKYYADNQIIASYSPDTTIFTGIKYLSDQLTSLKSINWFSDYSESDSVLWTNMNYGSLEPEFLSDGNGLVSFLSGPTVNLRSNASATLWIAMAIGNDSTEMVNNMLLAESRYNVIMGVEPPNNDLPHRFALQQNYPNPFNPVTSIVFNLSASEAVKLDVFNMKGEWVTTLVNNQLPSGQHLVHFDGTQMPSGVYIYTLTTSQSTQSRKMILLK